MESDPRSGACFGTTLLRPPRMVRWSGFLVAAGGMVYVFAAFVSVAWMVGWLSPISPGYEMFAEAYTAKRLRNMSLALSAPLGAFLVSAGLPGMCAVLAMRPNPRTRTAKAGVALALASSMGVAALTVYDFMPRYFERDPTEFIVSQSAYAASFLGWTLGVALVGASALRARSLGRWRFLPAPLAVSCLPARQAVLLLMYPVGSLLLTGPSLAFAALIEAPRAAGGVGWILFGVALARAWEKELEATKRENLALVRSFYERVWNEGNLGLADEILDPEFTDRRHRLEGAEAFKNYLADLRTTFPDLTLAIHSQTAEGNEITTRCKLHGTDRGGVLYHPPTNKKVTFPATFADTVRDGRIFEHRGKVDEAALFRQLGLEKSGKS